LILHIITEDEWEKIKNGEVYTPESISEEGFIHCAKEEQAVWVANTFYRGSKDLLLLLIDPGKVNAKIVYEDTANTGMLFPHIYGSLNLDAVVKVIDFKPDINGDFKTVYTP
jgi:uncharacterized protein (DUF952 family)